MSQVNPEDVKAFLATETPGEKAEPLTPGHEIVDLDDLKKELEEEQRDTKEIHDSVEENRNKTFEPDKSSLATLSSWAFAANNLEVDISDQEKALYVKSLFNDVPLQLPIELEMGISFSVRALTNFELEIVFLTLEELSKEEKIVGPAQYATIVQQCAVALQLVKMGDVLLNAPSFSPGDNVQACVKTLRERIENVLGHWAWPKWQAAVTALRIFETKMTICNENARKANFWQTAGAS